MKIVILTNNPFPYGMAQTNRLIAMSKGLISAGAIVSVLISKATESSNQKNKDSKGCYQGVDYLYTAGTSIRPKGKLKRIILFYRGLINILLIIIRENRKNKIDVIFLGVYSNTFSFIILTIVKILGIKIIQERSEYPFLSYKNDFIGQLKLKIYLRLICSRFDGFIVISKALQNYFHPYLKKSAHKYLLPILVETERFNNTGITIENVISYCGSMQGNKDGVPILIEAFHRISSKFPETNLRLIGSKDFKGFAELENRIKELKLSGRVEFTGRVEREEMPKLLLSSKILALARPESKQAEGGFPTKLGEYLAAGRLIIVTKVGDIPDYLTHRKNALLAEPDSVQDFSEKLDEALSDEKKSNLIAMEGNKLAQHEFNYIVQGDKLYNWLKSFVKL